MKKIFVAMLMVLVLLAAGCDDSQTAKQGQTEPEGGMQLVQELDLSADGMELVQVPGLPEDKWRDGEQWADDEVWRFDLAGAWYYNDTDYLVYGDSCTRAGRQSKVFRVVNGSEPEQVFVWPADRLHDYTDSVIGYYLPVRQKLVLCNPNQCQLLLLDAQTGAEPLEITPPMVDSGDLVLWLGEGRYLFCRIEQDPEEMQRTSIAVSLYDESLLAEQQLAELSGGIMSFVPPTVEQPDRWLLLSEYGDLCELILPEEGEAQVQVRRCYEEWPTAEPWLYYGNIQLVQDAVGDYAVWQVWCEDDSHYQVVDLAGGLLGECTADDDNGGGLLAAYGDTIYFSRYFTTSADFCQVDAYNYLDNSREVIFGTSASGLAESHPGLWGFGCGAVSPDGGLLLMLADDYVVSWPLEK